MERGAFSIRNHSKTKVFFHVEMFEIYLALNRYERKASECTTQRVRKSECME